jgi:purine-nucleoside phosphorylase
MAPMSLHIGAQKGEISEKILLPGDPLRAKWVAENYLDGAKQYNSIRNMFGYTGTYRGERISVQGTGMGLPSLSIYVTELFNEHGVESAIRIGTCGAIQEKTKVGPHADFGLLQAAHEASKKFDRVHVGGVSSMDYFYDETDANEKLIRHGVLALEMEASQLYSIAARKGKKALAVLTVSDHVITHEAMDADARERTLNDMVEVALAALSAN